MSYQRFTILITFYFLYSCARVVVTPENAARVSKKSDWEDQGSTKSFVTALSNTINSLKKSDKTVLALGNKTISKTIYIKSLEAMKSCSSSSKRVIEFIKSNFTPYTVYGKDRWGEILMTSYYEPVLKGSRKKTKTHSTAIFSPPKNLVEIKLNQFETEDYGLKSLPKKTMSAQITQNKYGQMQVTPLPSREDIDFKGALKNKRLEIIKLIYFS